MELRFTLRRKDHEKRMWAHEPAQPKVPQLVRLLPRSCLSSFQSCTLHIKMADHDDHHGALFGICNPLLDISVNAEQALFDKYVF